MASDSELIRLEEYVDKLLGEFSVVKAEKQRLEQLLREQQTENKRLVDTLNSIDSERTDVSDRVTSIIARLERWEADLESDMHVSETRDIKPSTGKKAPVFKEEPAQDEDDQGGVQGSLFSE